MRTMPALRSLAVLLATLAKLAKLVVAEAFLGKDQSCHFILGKYL